MALSQDELKLAETLKRAGKSSTEIMKVIAKRRSGQTETLPDAKETPVWLQLATGAGKGFVEGAIGTAQVLQRGGQEALGLTPGVDRQRILDETGFPSLKGAVAQEISEQLGARTPGERAGKVLGFATELGAGFIPSVGKFAARRVGTLGQVIERAGDSVGQTLLQARSTPIVRGTEQTVKEFAERVPRFLGRVREGAEEAATRSEVLKNSPPVVRNALKSGLDERFINTVQSADEPTARAYREMVDIAENTKGGTLRPKQQPSIVAGRVVEDQFDLIERERRAVGKRIEEVSNSLPNAQVNMRPSFGQLEAVLSENGIAIRDGVLDISRSALSKAQGTRLQELYDTAIRSGDTINAKLVHGMDRLFSQLQREARFDQLDNIFLNVNGKDVNAFSLFRDVYRNQLDNLSPEIRELNGRYRILRQLVDDIEGSIFKSPKFEATKAADPAEFAKVNLRRLAGEAQSSPAYQAVVEQMDVLARELGYTGARADDLIFFAQELRKLYPETLPSVGFQGGIRAGLSDVLETVTRVGAPNIKDQQKALRELINVFAGAKVQ